MLEFSVDGKEAGATLALQGPRKLPFHAVVDSRLPVDKVEVLVSGKVVATRDNPAGAARVEFAGELTIEDSAWVAARAYSAKVLPIQSEYRAPGAPVLAHTSPVYVDVNGRPRRSAKDAQALAQWCERTMEWARTTARYPSEARRQEVLALYARARDIYERQARGD
jgi:hypothetical protein